MVVPGRQAKGCLMTSAALRQVGIRRSGDRFEPSKTLFGQFEKNLSYGGLNTLALERNCFQIAAVFEIILGS